MRLKYEDEHEAFVEARKLDRARWLEDVAWMLSSERGRHFLYTFFDISYINLDPMSGDPLATAHLLGRQAAARDLATMCMEADFDGFMLMQRDGIAEKKKKEDNLHG